jgi:ribosomal protein S18 acetylase RimI-like enzyme
LSYHLTPWDRPIFQGNTGAISNFSLRVADLAEPTYDVFREWCKANHTLLITCHLRQDQLAECAFLEARGFRFIELSYRPTLVGLEHFGFDPDIEIRPATGADEAVLYDIAAQTFETGRFHVDPQIDPVLGQRRYAAWTANAFRNPLQTVLGCWFEGRLVAFMIDDAASPTRRRWSLFAVAPDLKGRGLALRLMRNILAYQAHEGNKDVITSVSSLNLPIQNVLRSLGFRFPAPEITLHWCPFGPIPAPPLP